MYFQQTVKILIEKLTNIYDNNDARYVPKVFEYLRKKYERQIEQEEYIKSLEKKNKETTYNINNYKKDKVKENEITPINEMNQIEEVKPHVDSINNEEDDSKTNTNNNTNQIPRDQNRRTITQTIESSLKNIKPSESSKFKKKIANNFLPYMIRGKNIPPLKIIKERKSTEKNISSDIINKLISKNTSFIAPNAVRIEDHNKNEEMKKKSELLRIGDVILMRFNYLHEDTQTNTQTNKKYILAPERIISKKLKCYPTSLIINEGLIKQALFRIENPQSFIYKDRLERAKKFNQDQMKSNLNNLNAADTAALASSLDDLVRLANEEKKENETGFLLNYSNEVTFGQIIQLRNLFNNEVLNVDLNKISEEIGCLEVTLNNNGGENAWFKLLPSDKLRNEGDCISYSDNFFIIPMCVYSESYLHVNVSDLQDNCYQNGILETNMSIRKSIFKMSLFESTNMSANSNEKLKNVVKSIDAIKLYNNDMGGYLTLCENKNKLVALPNINLKNSGGSNKTNSKTDNSNKLCVETNINDNEESNTIWEFQFLKPLEGKQLNFGMSVKIRHVSTGLFLRANDSTGDVHLSVDSESIFILYSDKQEENINESFIYYDSIVCFYSDKSDSYIKADNNSMIETQYVVSLSNDVINHSNMFFKIEGLNSITAKFIYNITYAKDHLMKILNNIYTVLVDERGYTGANSDQFYISDTAQVKLLHDIMTYTEILMSIKEETVFNKPGEVRFRKLQNFYSEQGYIRLLLKFISIFDYMRIMIFESKDIKENLFTNASKVTALSYQIIHILIKDNYKSCISLHEEIDEINQQLKFHKLNVMMILKDCFDSGVFFNEKELYNRGGSRALNNYLQKSNNGSTSSGNKYTRISFWMDKMNIIDETQNNFEEQTLLIQLITMLCVDVENKPILVNQHEVKIKLFEEDIIPLKFGLRDWRNGKRPYIIFHINSKMTLTIADFFSFNPTLESIFTERKSAYIEYKEIPFFYLDKIKMKKHIEYICAVLDLYYTIILGRNEINNFLVSDEKHCGLTFDHLWNVLMNTEVSMKIRIRYIKLLRVLYIDIDPFERISKNRSRCFFWEESSLTEISDDNILNVIYKWHISIMSEEVDRGNLDNLRRLNNFILEFWRSDYPIDGQGDINDSLDKDTFQSILEFMDEACLLTKEMIDFAFFSKNQIQLIMNGVAHFFSIFNTYKPNHDQEIRTDKSKANSIATTHWLERIAVKCLDSEYTELKAILFKIFENSIQILDMIVMIKEDFQIYQFILKFKAWYDDGNSLADNPNIMTTYNEIINQLSVFEFEVEDEFYIDDKVKTKAKTTNDLKSQKDSKDYQIDKSIINLNYIEGQAEQSPNKEKITMKLLLKKFLEKNKIIPTIPLDMYLLQVIFTDYDNEFTGANLDNKALNLLIKYFNEYDILKNELAKVELVINDFDKEIFLELYKVRKNLKLFVDNLVDCYIGYALKKKNLSSVIITEDLIRTIEVELISKLNLKDFTKTPKIQNFCRNLKIHEKLIDMIEFVLKYEKNISLISLIYKFLYCFSYRNYFNQIILKKHFEKFLFHLGEFDYVCELVIEILNIYKGEVQKSKKYIEKIFFKIEKNNSMSIDVINLLKSMNTTYTGENIRINQEIILKKFLSHKEYLKLYLTIEERAQLSDMLSIIKSNNLNAEKTLKNLYLQTKFIELMTQTSTGNFFCILNCRKLVKIEDLVQFLISNDIPYTMKPAYLEFFLAVFYPHEMECMGIEPEKISPIPGLEVMRNLILTELTIFPIYLIYFIELFNEILPKLNNKNKENYISRVQLVNKYNKDKILKDDIMKKYLVNDNIDIEQLSVVNIFRENKFVTSNRKKEYWRFLLNYEKNKLDVTGALPFLWKFLNYIKKNSIQLDKKNYDMIMKIKSKISELNDTLSYMEEILGDNIEIAEIHTMLHKCSLAFPQKRGYFNFLQKIADKNFILKERGIDNIKLFDVGVKHSKYSTKPRINAMIDGLQQDNIGNNITIKKISKFIPVENLPLKNYNSESFSINDEDASQSKSNISQQSLVSDSLSSIDIDKMNKNVKQVLDCINEYLTTNKLTIIAIFNLLDIDKDKSITKFEFIRNLKVILNRQVTSEAIEDTYYYIDIDKDGSISLKELTTKLTQYNRIRRKKVIKELDEDDIKIYCEINSLADDKSYKITNIFQHFIVSFHETQEKLGHNKEILKLAEKLNILIENSAEGLKKFINRLSETFDKKKYKIYLLKIMSMLINLKILFAEKLDDSENKNSIIRKIQLYLNEGGIINLVMKEIEKNNTPDVIEEALNLMILMLKNGNEKVQKTVLDYFANPINSFNFLSYVREKLNTTAEYLKRKLFDEDSGSKSSKTIFPTSINFYSELNRYHNKPINLAKIDILYQDSLNFKLEKELSKVDNQKHFRIAEKLLLLLQLFCENCYEPFQNFLREQDFYAEDKNTVSSINIVYEVGNFLITLISFDHIIYTDNEAVNLIKQTFLTLADFCIGPCKENQILLGKQKNLWKIYNHILSNELKFNIQELTHIRRNIVFVYSIHLLKTLITRENLEEIGEVILNEFDIYLLIEKLVDIYFMKITHNLNNLFSGRVCTHIVDTPKGGSSSENCDKLKCRKSKNHISVIDLKYIHTGFDIFIILTYLKDSYPDSEKLQYFEMNKPAKVVTYDTSLSDNNGNTDNAINTGDTGNINTSSIKNNKRKSSVSASVSSFRMFNSFRNVFDALCRFLFYCIRLIICCKKNSTSQNLNINIDLKKNIFNFPNKQNFIKKKKDDLMIINRFMRKYNNYFYDAFLFFAANTSNVEIDYRNTLVVVYFKIPFIFKFLTNLDKHNIIHNTRYTNHQARLEEFFLKIDSIRKDLVHQQGLGRLRNLTSQWKLLSHISFIITILINLLLIIFLRFDDNLKCTVEKQNETNTSSSWLDKIYFSIRLFDSNCQLVSISVDNKITFTLSIIQVIITSLQIIQISINILALLFYVIHQYPLINSQLLIKANQMNFTNYDRNMRKYSGSILFSIMYKLFDKNKLDKENYDGRDMDRDKNEKMNRSDANRKGISNKLFYPNSFLEKIYKKKFVNLIFNSQVQLFLIYLIFTGLGIFINPFYNSILLLDIIRRFKFLQKILSAINNNMAALLSSFLLCIVLIYLYSIVSFIYLRKYFESSDFSNSTKDFNAYCDSLPSCFLTIYGRSLLFHEGLLSTMVEIPRTNSDYWIKYFMDISFYLVITILMMNILFSIIIDCFAELRDTSKKQKKLIRDFCFVCGIPKYQFDIKGQGAWISHYKYEHNIFAYLYFLIELEEKDTNDCDSLEKYVKTCIENKNYKFLPLNKALSLSKEKNEN